ncbi:uncharacterized protein LOC128212478 [Mya arenaria]|uniref:uncharacterized protein LOC128212478 n=1 Tax=Mya arenaria TaxID=6604 RepID=UPI0022E7797C|nr:uncharacterized protein LOC128212478 [Mya arenaria]
MLAITGCLIVILAIGHSEATVCHTDVDCGSGECCYIRPEFLVVSKRQLTLGGPSLHSDTGVCEAYRPAGDHCDVFEHANGHCGCTSGYSCQWVPEPTVTAGPGGKRSMVYHPGPGSYKCAPQATQSP